MNITVNGYTFMLSTSYDYRDSRMFVGVGIDDVLDDDYISALKVAQKAMRARKDFYEIVGIYQQTGCVDFPVVVKILNDPDALFTQEQIAELTAMFANNNGNSYQVNKEYKLSDRRRRVFERDDFTCQNPHCGHHDPVGMSLQVDHIIPSSRGGSNRKDNLQTLCRDCNQEKLAMTMDEYLEWLEDRHG